MIESAISAIKNGLMVIAQPNKPLTSRSGSNKTYLIDSRGAGVNIELREIIISEMERCIKSFPDFEIIGGVSKSGTSWGAWLSWKLRMPFVNVLLDGKRESGLQREIEGDVEGKNVVLVDNWLRSGKSIQSAIEVVKRNGGNVIGALVITKIKDIELNPTVIPIWELDELFEAARITNLVPDDYIFQ